MAQRQKSDGRGPKHVYIVLLLLILLLAGVLIGKRILTTSDKLEPQEAAEPAPAPDPVPTAAQEIQQVKIGGLVFRITDLKSEEDRGKLEFHVEDVE